jgi:NAD(P)-dependent dehydrogenase (short-subunit alcohol dehydrogenase family)
MTAMSQAGRVALITGANTGIGLVSARELARLGARVFIACRSPERAQHAADVIQRTTSVRVESLALDLGDFSAIRRCAAEFLAKQLPLHLLVNNAGLAGKRGLTADGFEVTFGTNHLGHFLLTELLLPRIRESGHARIVTVASEAHYGAKHIDFERLREPASLRTGFGAYQVSKLANVLFSAELARRLAGSDVRTYALHPGTVATDVWRELPWPLRSLVKLGMISAEEGARTTLYCATSPELAEHSGRYYDDCKQKQPSKLAQDLALASELWKRSEQWTRQ